jgi:hypothetical protein
MENALQSAVLIEKERIPALSFKSAIKGKQSKDINDKLNEAMRLGNNHHGKVAIIFEDDEGLKRVETTVWAAGAKFICLKGGGWMPISHILDVKL